MTIKKIDKKIRLKNKIRARIFGTSEKPRLSVFRSNNYMYAQIINDEKGATLASASDSKLNKGTKTERAKIVGAEVAKLALGKGIKSCVFDRNGFKYTGRVKSLADAARESGLKF
jgi:large subunit ribosomal protein L18